MSDLCNECWYNRLDEESGEYFCDITLDEDEYERFINDASKICRYFRPDPGDYGIVRKQN